MPQAVPFVAGLFTSLGVPAAAATVLGNVVVYGGLIAAQFLLNQPKKQSQPKQAPPQVSGRYDVVYRRYITGRRMIGSIEVFADAKNETNNWHRAVLVHCDGQIDGYEQAWFDDTEVEIDGSGNVISPAARWMLGFGGGSLAALDSYDGAASQTSNTRLQTDFPNTWTTAHRLDGIAYTVRSCKTADQAKFAGIYRGGNPPAVRRVIRGQKVPNPERGVEFLWADPDSWEWDPNAAKAILGLLLRTNWESNGFGISPEKLALEEWIEAVEICAEPRTAYSGIIEQQWEIHDEWNSGERPIDILNRWERACAMQVYTRSDGLIGIRGGRWRAPTITFTPQNCIVDIQLERGPDFTQAANVMHLQFSSPDHQYALTPGTDIEDSARIAHAGRRIPDTFEAPAVVSHRQAQHLAYIEMRRKWAGWRGTIVTDARGQVAWNEPVIWLVHPDYGIGAPMAFRVVDAPKESEDGLTIEWLVAETDASEWEPPPLSAPPELAPPSDPSQRIRPPSSIAASYAAGSSGNKTITFTVARPTRRDCGVEIVWWIDGAATTSIYETAGGQYFSMAGTYTTVLLQPGVLTHTTGDIPTGSVVRYFARTLTPNNYRSEHTTAWIEGSDDTYPYGSHTVPTITLT